MSTIPPISQSRLVTPAAIARLILSVWWMRTKLSYRKCSSAFSKLHPHQKSWLVTDPCEGDAVSPRAVAAEVWASVCGGWRSKPLPIGGDDPERCEQEAL